MPGVSVIKPLTLNSYNCIVRNVAIQHSQDFGVDTSQSRRQMAYWMRRIRSEYPFSQMKAQLEEETANA